MTAPLTLNLHSGETIALVIEKSKGIAVYHNEKWDGARLFGLIAECPELKEDAHTLAKVVYHLLLRNGYHPLDSSANIERFQDWYQKRYHKDTVMHEPEIHGQYLEFFVESNAHDPSVVRVPFQGPNVICMPLVAQPAPDPAEAVESLSMDSASAPPPDDEA